MNILDIRSIWLAIMALTFTASAGATTVTYQLNESNKFQDGTDYISVNVSDDTPALLKFDVDILPVLSAYAGSGFGMQKIGFNLFSTTPANIYVIGLPAAWSVGVDQKMGVVGTRQVTLSGPSTNRQTALSFSVLGLTLADVDSDFAVHVAGIDDQLDVCDGSVCQNINGAYLYANAGAVVPVPAAAWLFVSGLIGLISLGRRRG